MTAYRRGLLSVGAICEVAGLRRAKLFREIASGNLKATKVGNRIVIQFGDLVDWLQKNPSQRASSNRVNSQIDPFDRTALINLLKFNVNQPDSRLAYSILEFARLTSLSLATVKREIKSGRLPSVKITNGRVIIPAEDGLEWIKGLKSRKVG